MHKIQFPDDQYQRRSALAQAAGDPDVSAFIAAGIGVPCKGPRGTLVDDHRRVHVAMIPHGEPAVVSSEGQNMKTAIVNIAGKHGLNITFDLRRSFVIRG